MKGPDLSRNQVESLLETPFLRVADLRYAEGKHYYVATRRPLDHLVAVRCEEDFRAMQPDAVTCVVILRTPGDEPRLLLMREYRYPAGRFLLSPPAGLMDPEDLAAPSRRSPQPCGRFVRKPAFPPVPPGWRSSTRSFSPPPE